MSKELYVELGELANEVQSQLVTKIRTAGMEAEMLWVDKNRVVEEYDVVKGQLATRDGELAKVQSSLKATDALWQSAEGDLIDAQAELETCKAALAACREQNAPKPPQFFAKFPWRHSNGTNPDQLEDMKRLNRETCPDPQWWRTYTEGFWQPPQIGRASCRERVLFEV